MKKIILLCFLLFLILNSVYGKRLPPPEVAPLENNNFIYEAGYIYTDSQDFGVLRIISKGEVKYNFTVPLYTVKINKFLERDVQWVFIKGMEFKNENTIIIVNERDKVFEFNTDTYKVTCISENEKKDIE